MRSAHVARRSCFLSLVLVASFAFGCAEPAKKVLARPTVPEACVTLGLCCDLLPEPEAARCSGERDAAASSDTGGAPCSRALASYRDRGFCGGAVDPGKTLAPGCALLSACCESASDESERAACDLELASFSGSAEGEDGCVASHAARVDAGICEAVPPATRGPSCTELLACCAALGIDAKSSCEDNVDQLAERPSAEDDCAASRRAYEGAGLCLER